MTGQKEIAGFVDEILEGTDKYLVEVVVQPVNRVTVYFDGDQGVNISDCQALSRKLEERLSAMNEDFELNVSSPGLDRPILLPRQYRKKIGRELDIVLEEGEKIRGVLVRADEDSIELEHKVKKPKKEIQPPNTVIEIKKIKTAKIIISFGK
jgi:ribosome maturation factor RimP